MKRLSTIQLWSVPAILLANLPGLKQVLASAPLRSDTDTVAMLDAMRDTGGLQGWWQWFTGDWFLHNGFYRPVTCLSLLLDYSLYGEAGWGYRLTNWLLAVLTALGVYALLPRFLRRWFGQVLRDDRHIHLVSLAGAIVLSLQQTNYLHGVRHVSAWLLVAGWLVWQNRQLRAEGWKELLRAHWWRVWLGAGAFFWGWDRLVFSNFERLMVWVPSRTALLSTCLAVWGLSSLVRWGDTGRFGYLLGAILLYAGACGAYEQPLGLVLMALVLAIAMRREWSWKGWLAFGAVAVVAVGVVALRFALLPTTLTGYQQQQLRSAPHLGLLHLMETVLPGVASAQYWALVGLDPYLFFFRSAWDRLIADLALAGVLVALVRCWRWFGWWLAWHLITYLPMSLLHPFEHYQYLPQVGQNAIDLALMAWGAFTLQQVTHAAREGEVVGKRPNLTPHPPSRRGKGESETSPRLGERQGEGSGEACDGVSAEDLGTRQDF